MRARDLLRLDAIGPLTPADAERLGERLQEAHDGDTDAMLAEAWMMGLRTARNILQGRHVCRICGCWELEACDGGCAWAEADLCTACEGKAPGAIDAAPPAGDADLYVRNDAEAAILPPAPPSASQPR